MKRRHFAGSAIGEIAEPQEMPDFCATHNNAGNVEVIPMQKINEAHERMLKSDMKYRFHRYGDALGGGGASCDNPAAPTNPFDRISPA